MTRLIVFLAVQVVMLGACSTRDNSNLVESAQPNSTASAAGGDGSGSAQPSGSRRFVSAVPLRPDGSVVVTGVLSFDSVEGGCAYLRTRDSARYQVIYPEGWRLDRTTGQLLGPDGQAAEPGAVVTIRGSIETDMASTCQVGPMFRATEVLSIE
jgi:hypothetical protein